jgi:hypothetical protein
MVGRIILGLALVVAGTYLSRITYDLSQRSSRGRNFKAAERSKPLLWIVSLAFVPLLGIQFFLMHIDAIHAGHKAWPGDVLAGVGLTCGIAWVYLIAKIRSR